MAKQLKVIFLGGVGEIGKNMTAIEYGDNILIIDSGSTFPNNDTPGVDLVIPDFSYILENKHKVRGILLTHGHEDHIGATPFLAKELPGVPFFGSKLTLALVESKMKEHNVKKYKLMTVKGGSVQKLTCFEVEFIKVSHSITGAMAIAITTPLGVIFHTGDYKIDYTPVDRNVTDLARIAEIGNNGVLLMLGESTNVEHAGFTISESMVGGTLDRQFATHMEKRLIIATFASNVHRVQQILNICQKYDRKVVFAGRSMKKISELAVNIGELTIPEGMEIDADAANKAQPSKICVITTGSQGEPMSALTRMAADDDKIKISDNDTILLSSSPIPGNEKAIYNVINNLYRRGAEVIYGSLEALHVSGHACQEELKLMLSLLKPKMFIPVHGEYRHLKQHAELAAKLNVPKANIMIPEVGGVFDIKKRSLSRLSKVEAGNVYVDGVTVGNVDSVVLRDRKMLSKDGFIVAIVSLSAENKQKSNVEVISRGLQLSDDMIEEMKRVVAECLNNFKYKNPDDLEELKSNTRKRLSNLIFRKLKVRPMVLPLIMEI